MSKLFGAIFADSFWLLFAIICLESPTLISTQSVASNNNTSNSSSITPNNTMRTTLKQVGPTTKAITTTTTTTTAKPVRAWNCTVVETDVTSYIFSRYNKMVRPVKNETNAIIVNIALRIFQLRELDEKSQTLAILGYLHQTWTDEFLAWQNVNNLSCHTDMITIPAAKVWVTDVTLRNAPDSGKTLLYHPMNEGQINPDGKFVYEPHGVFQVRCSLYFHYFPFDDQVCTFKFESWFYSMDMVEMKYECTQGPFFLDMEEFTDHPMWIVVDNTSYIGVSGVTRRFQTVEFKILLRRKPLFYIINLIVPSLIIAIAAAVIFALEPESINKVTVSVTCIVAYTVIQSTAIDYLPKTSDQIPLVILHIMLQMIFLAGLAIGSQAVGFIILSKAEFHVERPPAWAFKSCVILGKILYVHGVHQIQEGYRGVQTIEVAAVASEVMSKNSSSVFVEIMVHEQQEIKPTVVKHHHRGIANIKMQWTFIARVVDRFCCVLYILAIVLSPIIMYQAVPEYRDYLPRTDQSDYCQNNDS